jgi:hypothetical protein
VVSQILLSTVRYGPETAVPCPLFLIGLAAFLINWRSSKHSLSLSTSGWMWIFFRFKEGRRLLRNVSLHGARTKRAKHEKSMLCGSQKLVVSQLFVFFTPLKRDELTLRFTFPCVVCSRSVCLKLTVLCNSGCVCGEHVCQPNKALLIITTNLTVYSAWCRKIMSMFSNESRTELKVIMEMRCCNVSFCKPKM